MYRLTRIALAGVIALPACVPIPGSTINACVGCFNSSASTSISESSETPTPAMPAPPTALTALLGAGSEPTQNTPKASPDEADPTPAARAPEPAPVVEPPPAAPGAGSGAHVAPADEPPPARAGPLADTLREAEGLSLTPYRDTGGTLHICYGHRITVDTCDRLLAADIDTHLAAARRVVGESLWADLTERRRRVLAELAFMHGEAGLAGFAEMLEALRDGDYDRAADEITDSLTARRAPDRMTRLAAAMREG